MLKEREVMLELSVKVYYDEDFDQEELEQKLLKTLKIDNWDCSLKIDKIGSEKDYNG